MSGQDEKSASRGRGAARTVRSVGHTASGGHSPYRNHITREPNALPPQHKARHPVAHQEYPKRLYLGDGPSVRALSAEHEAELRAAHQASRAPDEDAEKAAIREKLAALGAPTPHHKTGLDKLRAILAEAEAAKGAQ